MGRFLLFPEAVQEPGTKHPQSLCLVFQLAALILAGDNQTGRQVGDADSTVCCIHALAAVAGSMENIDTKV